MTATDLPTSTCRSCRSTLRPGARFCVGCGLPVASVAPTVPAPRGPSPSPFPSPVPPAPSSNMTAGGTGPSRATVVMVALVAVLTLVLGVLVALIVRGPLGSPTVPGAGVGAPAPAPGAGPADPAGDLQATRRGDAGTVAGLVGRWVPQLSAKKTGAVAEGRTWDDAAILDEHRQLKGQHPDARLVWSGDYASFRGGDFWITLIGRGFATAGEANAWCDRAGFDGDHCYAKRLTLGGGPNGNSVMRSGSSSGSSSSGPSASTSSAGAEPTLGDSSWAPGVTGFGSVRPREINANGDGTSYAEDITWQSWGGPTATGHGTAAWVPPDGISADATPTSALVVASDLGDCRGHLGYRTVVWYFPGKGETAPEPGAGYHRICTPS